MSRDSVNRSILKTLSWRVLATLTTVTLVYIFVGDIEASLTIGGLEVVLKMIIYYFHERVWARVPHGTFSKQKSS